MMRLIVTVRRQKHRSILQRRFPAELLWSLVEYSPVTQRGESLLSHIWPLSEAELNWALAPERERNLA